MQTFRRRVLDVSHIEIETTAVTKKTSITGWLFVIAVMQIDAAAAGVLAKARTFFMATVALRSPSEKVGGLFYFGRMLDKIRLHAKGELPPDYHANLGRGFDEKCANFLRINYDQLVERVNRGEADEEILQWSFENGRRPDENEVHVRNEFMRKR